MARGQGTTGDRRPAPALTVAIRDRFEGEAVLAAAAALVAGPAARRAGNRHFARQCLDWSERRPHIGGALGAALLRRCEALGWTRRAAGTRTVTVTPAGRLGLRREFGV